MRPLLWNGWRKEKGFWNKQKMGHVEAATLAHYNILHNLLPLLGAYQKKVQLSNFTAGSWERA